MPPALLMWSGLPWSMFNSHLIRGSLKMDDQINIHQLRPFKLRPLPRQQRHLPQRQQEDRYWNWYFQGFLPREEHRCFCRVCSSFIVLLIMINHTDSKNSHGYQVNLLSDSTQNTGILAQSQQFNVTGSSDSTSTTTATTLTSSTSTKDTTTGSQTKTTSGTNTATTASSASSSGIASGSVSGTPTGSSTSAPTASLNAGGSIVAHPLAAAGVFAGAIAFAL